jgi:hypothetical protein
MNADHAFGLDSFAKCILKAKDIRDLHHFLCLFENECREIEDADVENELAFRKVEITQLPTFGGPAPEDTTGVWSWNEDELLTGEGAFDTWHFEPREDA